MMHFIQTYCVCSYSTDVGQMQ